ncbi:MAG: helix-hairpin-helix domain-containing protein, partial [Lachnospiraceae bacterium]|nr:helix-hairpin-helix domain-containing protein [Lachnospiraceae bacterium]
MTEQLQGTITHIVYRNEENGYTVFELTGEECEETCTGYFAGISEGMVINAQGIYMEHASYGRQFKVESYKFREPETKEAIELYLGSGAIKGIGKTLAKRIVRKFGDDAIRIFEEEPERLSEIKGISPEKARTFGEEAARKAGMRKAVMFLENLGITLRMSIRIYKKYGEDVYGIIRENPYRLSEDIDGIGFLTADRLAQKAGIAADSPFRIRSGILFVLATAAGDGHVCLPEEQLTAKAAGLLAVDEGMIEDAVTELVIDRQIVIKE